MSEQNNGEEQAEVNMKTPAPLTDDQEVDALAIAESLLLGGHETDKTTGEILPRNDGTPYAPAADSWSDYSEQDQQRASVMLHVDTDEFPDTIPEQFLGEPPVELELELELDEQALDETVTPNNSWWRRTFKRKGGVDNSKHNSNSDASGERQPAEDDKALTSANYNLNSNDVISPESYREEPNPSTDAEPHDSSPPYLVPQSNAITSKRTIISLAVAVILGASSLGLSGYQVYLARSNTSSSKLITALEAKMDQRIEQLTDSISVNAVNAQQADNTLTIDVQRLEADLKSSMQQLNELKEQTSKLHDDVANGVQAGVQAKELTEQLSRTIATLNESLTATASEVAVLKKNRPMLSTKISAPAMEVARAVTSSVAPTKTRAISSTRKVVRDDISSVTQPGVTSLLGYKLFSVDDWGGVLLVTMTQGEEVQRLQVGDFLQDWRVDTVDLNNKSVVFVKGALRTTVIASGG